MLVKKNRLSGEKEFKKIFARGKFVFGKFINLKFYFEKNINSPKIAITISKKVEPLATKRNKIKRQISKIIKDKILLIKSNLKIIITVKKNPDNYALLSFDIYKCFQKGNLITND